YPSGRRWDGAGRLCPRPRARWSPRRPLRCPSRRPAACESRRGPSTGRRRRVPGSSWFVVEDRKAGAEEEPALGSRTCGHLAAIDLDAFADTDETVAEAVALRAPLAVVPPLNRQLVRPIANGHVRVAGMRMLERIRQAFLDDAISGEVNPPREREGLAVHMESDGQPGTADLAQQ